MYWTKVLLAFGVLGTLLLALTELSISTSRSAAAQANNNSFGSPAPVEYTPLVVSQDDAQKDVDFHIKLPTIVPAGSSLLGVKVAAPSFLSRYPSPTTSQAQELLATRDRARPVDIIYEGPSGKFTITYPVGYAARFAPADPRYGPPREHDPLANRAKDGTRRIIAGFEFVERSIKEPSGDTLNEVVWVYKGFGWFGRGQFFSALAQIRGTLPTEALVAIARSLN